MRRSRKQVIERASLCIVTVVLSACAHRAAPPVITPPVVVPEPPLPVVAPVPTRWTLPTEIPSATYSAKIVAKLERDSAGKSQREEFETRAIISFQQVRDSLGALRGSGRVDSFTVRGLERALSPTADASASPALSVPISIVFDAVLNATMARVTTRPPLVNECDQVEAGATALVRELLLRIPASLSVGDEWRDSSTTFVCRGGIPITVKQRNTYRVDKNEERDGRMELELRRATETSLDGAIRSAWRTVELSGTSRGEQRIRVEATSGGVRTITGTSTLALRVTDSARRDQARTQAVVQSLELTFERKSN